MAESSNTFYEFLGSLSKDPSARSSFVDDPVGAMDRAGLSDTQKLAILSQDEAKIQSELGPEVEPEAFTVTVIVTILVSL